MSLELAWVDREPPLKPIGVIGLGDAGRALARRLLARGDCADFRGLAGESALVLLGRDLPWAEGVIWLGREPEAPGLLLPTRVRLVQPAALVARKLRELDIEGAAALVPQLGVVVPLVGAQRLDEAKLREWLG